MREFSHDMETTTEFGSASYVSEFKSRSADWTKNNVDHEFSEEDRKQMRKAQKYIREHEMICVDRKVGRHEGYSFCCRYFVPKKYARIALAWAKLMDPAEGAEPDFYTVQIPEWKGTRIRAFPEKGYTYVLGSDYTGEAKMSFLRVFLYKAKQHGGLGMHAGSKIVEIEGSDGELRDVGQVFLGLSATGKSTLTSHGLGLEPPERAEMLQDDVCAFLPDGEAVGSEGGGLYVKTIDLEEEGQPELYHAVTKPHAVLENVWVEEDGMVDFANDEITRNSRAVILRDDLESAADEIDLQRIDQLFFITRNPEMPPVARLTHHQAAAAFMLGESIQTSAGDPEHAGEAIRVVGTNPFVIGSEGEEGNRFLELIQEHDVECFLLNTGYLGDKRKQIDVRHSVAILKALARGEVSWRKDERLDLQLPEEIEGMDIDAFYPPDYIPEFDATMEELRQDRGEHLSQFDDLREDIKEAVY
jgi:phosphoenolpyruvate carboxykinase (ATP)